MILRKSVAVIFLASLFGFLLLGQSVVASVPVRIACVGDSITWGVGLHHRHTEVYAALLQKRLGKGYRVLNCGRPGATALKHIAPNHPGWMISYWQAPQFKRATAFKPNIVIIMLGTNDTNPCNRLLARKNFTRDYYDLVRHFEKLSTRPKIFICLPPSLENGTVKGPRPPIPAHGVVASIVRIVRTMHLKGVNIFQALAGRWNLFISDRIHPNAKGQALMATLIYHALVKAGAVHR